MKNGNALAERAMHYVKGLAGSENSFASENEHAYLQDDPFCARTRCSSFLRLILRDTFDVPDTLWIATFGRSWPRAVDFHAAATRRLLPRVERIEELRAGDLGFIGYDVERNGFTGHAFIVMSTPMLAAEKFGALDVYGVDVVDSCRSSHGPGDTRFVGLGNERGGIGCGRMRIVSGGTGAPAGYLWSARDASELMLNGKGQEVVFCRVPSEWKPRDAAQKEIGNG
jgi:hypothetical protein